MGRDYSDGGDIDGGDVGGGALAEPPPRIASCSAAVVTKPS